MAARLKFIKGKWSKKLGRKESSAQTNAQFAETAEGQGAAEKLRSVSLILVRWSYLHFIALIVFFYIGF